MSRPTNYDILKDIQQSVNRLEDKLDKRIVENANKIEEVDKRIDELNGKVENLLGKIGVGVMVLSSIISSGIAFVFNLLKKDN